MVNIAAISSSEEKTIRNSN